MVTSSPVTGQYISVRMIGCTMRTLEVRVAGDVGAAVHAESSVIALSVRAVAKRV